MKHSIFLWAILAFTPAATQSQPSQNAHKFEVASIKLVPSNRPGRPEFRSDPGRIDVRQTALAVLMQRAYAVPWYRIIWTQAVDSDGRKFSGPMPSYDIVATMPATATREQQRVMLQGLLEERLQLRVHREPRELPVYELTVAKSGLRLRKSQNPSEDASGRGPEHLGHELRYRHTVTLSSLLDFLRAYGDLDRPIVDQTGLDGVYEIDLRWAYEDTDLVSRGLPDPSNMPSLFAAMEKQLGLKLAARKSVLEMVVIDRINRVPTEN